MPFNYYIWSTYRRKSLDGLQQTCDHYLQGVVIDIGGRDRGRYNKPKDRVKQWIFADSESKHNPDIVLDVSDMSRIDTESMDVVCAIELFEHVADLEKGLNECNRILKQDGLFFISTPFLMPIHGDPCDYHRPTQSYWHNYFNTYGYDVIEEHIMRYYFTHLAETIRKGLKELPLILRRLAYCSFPLLDLLAYLDKTSLCNQKLKAFHGGYFFVARKRSV